jgi:hypothetical protein
MAPWIQNQLHWPGFEKFSQEVQILYEYKRKQAQYYLLTSALGTSKDFQQGSSICNT